MNTQDAYNSWAKTYDTVENKTRDLEASALRTIINKPGYSHILELGCGTGKNSGWLAGLAEKLTAVDFSENMISTAKEKISTSNITFQQADLTKEWAFYHDADLIVCSLVLEHIEDLGHIFREASRILQTGGLFYICELHPYKQLEGSRAKFEAGNVVIHLEYFIHHISDYFLHADRNNFICVDLQEWFDNNDRSMTPRLCSFLFKKR